MKKISRSIYQRRNKDRKLYTDGYNEWDMAFFTGLPIYVVKEYEEIIKSYEKKMIKWILKINTRGIKGSYGISG